MKMNRIAVVLALLLAVASAPAQAPDAAQLAFEKLKTLAGEWEGTHGAAGKWAKASYTLTSDGTVLMERLLEQGGHEMVTTYHMDNGRLLMTHYCAAGNQPRMQAAGLEPDGKRIRFAFRDVTNLANPNAGHMRALEITLIDANHLTQAWTWRENGKDTPPEPFQLVRMK